MCRSHLESKLKVFNQYYEGKSGGIRSREVKKIPIVRLLLILGKQKFNIYRTQVNGRLILEGALRIYWGVRGVIHLKEDDDRSADCGYGSE